MPKIWSNNSRSLSLSPASRALTRSLMKSWRGLTRRSSMIALISSMVRSKARRNSGDHGSPGGARNHIMERDEDRFAHLVHVHHRIKQRIYDEKRAVILHTVERGTVSLDTVQHP